MNVSIHSPVSRLYITARRIALLGLTFATVAVAGYGAWKLLLINGFHVLEWPVLPLFVILMLPVALSFWTALFGFIIQLRGGDDLSLSRIPGENENVDLTAFRTAVIIPAYNEDATRLFAGITACYESAEKTGHLSHFDFFLLSDTTDPDAWIREEMAFHELRSAVSDPARLFYRNRRDNVEQKAGNIADFCATWGEDYRYMVVLDADSLMSGESLVNLVKLMEKHPAVGILQTPPVAVNRQSLFGRLLQFSSQAYGPIFITGLNYWQAGEANYWGHNAIIRVQPFVTHCRLPKLSGKAPLGGSILSHDFVEAALMRRAGWKVFVASELGGSYEEIPANLIGHAARDRRWCQGNLQHTRLLTMPGLNWVNRVHLAMGAMAYAASPLWMLMLLFSTADALVSAMSGHAYFHPNQSPFPVWHISTGEQALILFTSVLSLLLLPKILSLVSWLTIQRRRTAGFGGAWKLTLSIIAETLFSVLIAPVLAVLHSRFVIVTLLGRKVEWAPQDRGDSETRWPMAIRWHFGITILGIAWAVFLWSHDRELFWWLSPVIAGWVLAIPMSSLSSRIRAGQVARRWGLFVTPEETRPPFILRRFHEALAHANSRPWANATDGMELLLKEPAVRSLHLSLLPSKTSATDPLLRNRLEGLRLKARNSHPLLPEEKRELLWDAESIEELALNHQQA